MMLYVLKTVGAMVLFLGLYHVLLEKEKMFRFNRFYLLLSLVASLSMPFWVSSTEYVAAPLTQEAETSLSLSLPLALEYAPIALSSISTSPSIDWIWNLYIVGVSAMFLAFLFNCGKVFRFIKEGKTIQYESAKLILHSKIHVPFSFLHFIFLPQKSYEQGEIDTSLLTHEQAHVKQAHSLDNLFMELIHCLLWFNPLLIYYKKAIRLNHEFLADEAALATSPAPETYMHLLIQQAGRISEPQLASSLTYGKTKKRLTMMLKQSNPHASLCKQIFLLPVFVLAFWMFGQTQTIHQTATPIAESSVFIDSIPVSSTFTQESGILYDLNLEGKGGMQAYLEVEGNPKARRVKAIVDAMVKVSFTNESGAKVTKICKDLTQDEREWFWKLEQSQPSVFMLPKPLNPDTPTEAQMKDFLNPKKYGIWIDGVRVKNSEIGNYEAKDFHHLYKSGLARNAAHYGRYTYQLNLYTQKWFDNKYAGKKSGWWEKVELNGTWYYNKLN